MATNSLQSAWPTLEVQAASESLLRAFGGAVTLQFVTPVEGSDARQLGIEARATEDVRIAPALMQEVRGSSEKEVLIARGTLKGEMEARGVSDAASLFGVIAGVVLGEKLWRRVSVSADMIAGAEYMYRVRVRE